MNVEKIKGGAIIETEEDFNADEVREEIKQLRGLVIENNQKKTKGRDQKLTEFGHLAFLEEDDINNFQEEELLLFKEIESINPENFTEKEYDELSKKIHSMGEDKFLGDDIADESVKAFKKSGHSFIPFLSSLLANRLYQTPFHKEKMRKV
ncbi:MAG: hypothetical protein ABIH48_02175 [Candidatus Falkowbacteria bacterium]